MATRKRRIEPDDEGEEARLAQETAEAERALAASQQREVEQQQLERIERGDDGDVIGPGLLEDSGLPPDLSHVGGAPPERPEGRPDLPVPPFPVRLSRPDDGPTPDQNLWTLIRNRTDAVSFNNYFDYLNAVLCGDPRAVGSLPGALQEAVGNLQFLGTDGFEVLRAATEYFLMQEVGLVVDHPLLSTDYLQNRYDTSMGIDGTTDPDATTEFRRRNSRRLPARWLTELRDDYLEQLGGTASPRVLPYLARIMDRLRDLPPKPAEAITGNCYGVLQSRLVGPLGLELIWSYWHEEGMLVQTHNAVSNRFQNLRAPVGRPDPLARLEIDPLRRLNNVFWGWIQNRPFLLSVRRRAFEYDHHYGLPLLGTAAGEVDGADSRSQFVSAFHHLLHLCTIFYQQADDLTVQADGFPLLSALQETQLVLTAGAHNQYGDLPWTARVEMLMQMWMLARPEMREFLGGRVMVPYKEPWMDRVDAVKSMMGWTDVNVTHFRDLGTFGEQILLSVRYGSWASEIDSASAANWARYWRPEIQGYVHAYRAATGVDLRQSADTTKPGELLRARVPAGARDDRRAVSGPRSRRSVAPAPPAAIGRAAHPAAALPAGRPARGTHDIR